MRLHLTVQRNALPPVRILWTTDALGPLYSAAGKEFTISLLLEQVNDIIPLESGEWGLEDYMVEVGGFECLHFLEAIQVLKEGDEVCIRPLSTSDIRYRKLSGRHQISTDGKHLIDGVAFGRPFLRRAARPVIRIPPRKRPRLTYNDEDDEDNGGDEAQRQIVVHPDFEDDEASVADSDYCGDEGNVSENEEDLRTELNEVQKEADSANAKVTMDDGAPVHRQPIATGLGLRAPGFLLDENRNIHSAESNNPLLQDQERSGDTSSSAPTKRRRLNTNPKSSSRGRPKTAGGARKIGANNKSVRFDELELATPATFRLGSSDDSENDEPFTPGDDTASSADDSDESDKENATSKPRRVPAVKKKASDSDSSSSSDSNSGASKTSSFRSSDSSSDSSESEDEQQNGGCPPQKDEDLESTSSSGESSSSDHTSSVEVGHPKQRTKAQSQAGSLPASNAVVSRTAKVVHVDSKESKGPVPPGSGRKATQERNRRRRDRKKLLRLKDAGTLPEGATIADIRDLGAEGLLGKSEVAGFEARRQALLLAISSGGVDQDGKPEHKETSPKSDAENKFPTSGAIEESDGKRAAVEKSGSSASEKTLVDTGLTCHTALESTIELPSSQMVWSKDQASSTGPVYADYQSAAIASIDQPGTEIKPVAQRPRTKLDRDSSRRLVFGALGLRTPKTKDDEAKLRQKLAKDAEAARKPKMQIDNPGDFDTNSLPPLEDDSWKDKIELSAVECCHDGIELSTPPFPFVQRWDPQQQRGFFGPRSASRNMKKRKRNNKQYEASFEPLADGRATERRQGLSDSSNIHSGNDCDAVAGRQQDDSLQMSDDNLQAVNDQLLRETEGTYADEVEEPEVADDLPQLPEDLSTCPDLERESCIAGAIIAFKQLHMSSETNWQPKISEYRTALIASLPDEGILSLRTASRDRPNEKRQYDSATGERLYSKFEMPGYHEDESEDNDGLLELAFADLINPKLVKAAAKGMSEHTTTGERPLEAGLNDDEANEEGTTQPSEQSKDSISITNVSQKSINNLQKSSTVSEVTEQARKEIDDLIKDAGWHSSIQSNDSVQREKPDMPEEEPVRDNADIFQETHHSGTFSPQFNGFSSSPPAEEYQEAEEQVLYPTIRDLPSPASAESGVVDDPEQTVINSSEQADNNAIQTLREDFDKEMKQPFIPSTPDRPSHYSQKQDSSISPSEPSHPRSTPPPEDSLKSTIPDSQPLKPATACDPTDDTGANSPDSDSDFPSLEKVFTSFSSQRNPIKDEHLSSDEEEGTSILQSLPPHKAKVNAKNNHLTTGSDDANGHRNNNNTNNKTKNKNKPPNSSAPPSVPARTSKGAKSSSSKAKPPKSKSRLNRYEAAPRSSQDWIGTQVIDLTLQSDPVVTALEEEEEEEAVMGGSGYVDDGGTDSLPKGPGWVKKSRVGRATVR
ncbi:MAG: hypothetical protein Q9216_001890 [Gyalolechia sp. 2 TL-2023]